MISRPVQTWSVSRQSVVGRWLGWYARLFHVFGFGGPLTGGVDKGQLERSRAWRVPNNCRQASAQGPMPGKVQRAAGRARRPGGDADQVGGGGLGVEAGDQLGGAQQVERLAPQDQPGGVGVEVPGGGRGPALPSARG